MFRCTVLGGTPTMFVDVLNKKRELGIKTDCLEIAVTGGAPCSPKLFQSIKKDLGVKKIKVSMYKCT